MSKPLGFYVLYRENDEANGEYAKYTVRKIIDAYYGYETVINDLGDGKFESIINQ